MNKTYLTDDQLARFEVVVTLLSKTKLETHSSDIVPIAHWVHTGTNIYTGDDEEAPLDTEEPSDA